jgi:HK97 family phage portal protein
MSFLSRLLGMDKKTGISWLPPNFGWPVSKSGREVTALSSLEVSTVMACVRAISEGVSQVPVYIHSRDSRGVRGPRVAHPLLSILRNPNDWQDGFQFRECLLLHAALVGNAFVYISRRADGSILELIPIEPSRVSVTRQLNMDLEYRFTFEDGTSPVLPPGNVWHIRGPSFNTWMGLDAVKYAREAIGLAMAAEESHASFHKNGVQSSGILSVEGALSPERHKNLKAYIESSKAGISNAGKPMIVDNGAKWTPLSMTGVDAQHIETRKHQVLEICRHFRVSPMLVGASDTPTYASAEQMFIAHVVHCLTPWAERIEQSAARVLLTDEYELRHDFNGLMRGAAKDRGEFYAKSLGSGGSPAWATPNEIRAIEGDDPIEGGDELPKPVSAAAAEPDDEAKSIGALFGGIKQGMMQ